MKPSLVLAVVVAWVSWGSQVAGESLKIHLEPFIQNVEAPVYLTHDGTKRVFIVQQAGRIRVVTEGKPQEKPYLDIQDRVEFEGECGLLCVAFHPDFSKNGRFFVNYNTRENGLYTIISEFHADPDAVEALASTERVILKFKQPFTNHKGGQLLFGADGMLYIGTGDGGSGGDPFNHGQRLDTFLGKILRIDVDRNNGKGPYLIPSDNPFVNTPNAKPEIWAYGLRNPWRFCFDRTTGVMYAADVGQDKWEEVDIIEKGKNYGWNIKEGTHPFKAGRSEAVLVDPIIEYGRDVGICIIGGYVYRGKQFPELAGFYLYGDYGSGRIWGLKYEGGRRTNVVELFRSGPRHLSPSSFGEDSEGEIYVCDYHHGEVLKVITGAERTMSPTVPSFARP